MVGLHYQTMKAYLPRIRFLTVHYAYFIGLSFITSAIFWGTSSPAQSVRYIDSLYLTVSAMTLAGMNTVNLSTLNTFQQVLLFFLIMSGSAIWVSIAMVLVRKQAFERRFGEIVKAERLQRKARSQIGIGRVIARSRSFSRQSTMPQERTWLPGLLPMFRSPSWGAPVDPRSTLRPGSSEKDDLVSDPRPGRTDDRHAGQQSNQVVSEAGDDAEPVVLNGELPSGQVIREQRSHADSDAHIAFASDAGNGPEDQQASQLRRRMLSPYTNVLNRSTTLGELERGPSSEGSDGGDLHLNLLHKLHRNSTFHNLTEAERQQLGGAEYRAVCLLAVIVPIYFFLWQLLGGLGVGAYLAQNKASETESNGLNPWWTGFFFAISAFNNSGMSILDANMVPFQTSTYMLITMGLLILAGNTCYPIFLRWIIRAIRLMIPDHEYFDQFRDTVQFLLDHPRRSYTTLFPSTHTWWLLLSVIVLNGIDWVAFEVLNIDNPAVNAIPRGSRVLDGLFQALCVRSGGFYVVNISALQLGTQVIYVVMMYISVYPVVITMRHSNVYEERSLGIYADDPSMNEDDQESSSESSGSRLSMTPASGRISFIRHQLRAQMAYDLWWIALAVIIICIVEAGQFTRDPVTFSAFNIIFETVSAYGCVGISTGLPNQLYSFSGAWHTLSKLVLCAVMIRGRHRGLPVAIDKAIMLPSDKLIRAEEEDAQIRMERTMSHRPR
ncbi:Low-affinity potassium transport protein [Penicillium canariense]|uniref:Potassium transport protein n=1 Tax=Penicillium canariense TaxID=189055 RepID=A0A9W9IG75_9EURO|nr:Low-affinity potassium transport protein [Penicillium canariense]KAJ5176979.1 Low-affinity potassium transport protein [Penicillium canariense]